VEETQRQTISQQYRWPLIVGISLLVIVIVFVIGLVAWLASSNYMSTNTHTQKKDLIQSVALIVGGVVAILGAVVGFGSLYMSHQTLQHNQRALRVGQRNTLDALAQQQNLDESRIQEDVLQTYFQRIGDLLAENKLEPDEKNRQAKALARAYTLTTLRRIDGERKNFLVRSLWAAQLIRLPTSMISLSNANLDDAKLNNSSLTRTALRRARLRRADLSWTNLKGSDLQEALLTEANLTKTGLENVDLTLADLTGANLTGANLTNAILTDAKVTQEQLASCEKLDGAIMPHGVGPPQ
jgi:uncharacterized protein YjbI with pentapeptide repeats